jgi:NADH-quinone oxidoreductase subunit K
MIPAGWFLGLAILLFALGVVGFFLKRDLVMMFLAVEVMLNSGGLAFLALAKADGFKDGQVIALFIIMVAAAEAAVGLAIILLVFRGKKSIRADDIDSMKG